MLRLERNHAHVDMPVGDDGFGWNSIFIPNGLTRTLGEMNEKEFRGTTC
jgi:inosine/xanthosine triphosphate pyrophosphatase family protein